MTKVIVCGKIIKHCYISKSKINGSGVFAGQVIYKRAKIGSLSGKLISVKRIPKKFKSKDSIAIVELTHSMALDSRTFKNELCYINHSCEPNCFMRIFGNLVEVYALRTIKKGNELTLDYEYSHHEGKITCLCDSLKCKGYL